MAKTFHKMSAKEFKASHLDVYKSEHDFQKKFMAELEIQYPKIYDYAFAIPNGGHRHKAVAKKLKAEGVKAGVLDILILIPFNGYGGLFLESKYSTGLSDRQKEFIQKIFGLYKHEVIRTIDQGFKAIENYFHGPFNPNMDRQVQDPQYWLRKLSAKDYIEIARKKGNIL